jgi:hypothetical protein
MNQLLTAFAAQFAALHAQALALLRLVPPDKLYWQPRAGRVFPVYSCGEHLLRAAACVEQTFGGITANLWDDPFEWTLPETLQTPAHVAAYLAEVEATRQRGCALITDDDALAQELAVPTGEMQTLGALLLDTLARAAHHQGRAYATFRLFSDERIKSNDEG